ncbi:hypothetical protein ASZ90_018555 [hydrocarbon metagenome]|uniref:Uncharacterized protein n=1 Tax=hydrocarbon metagenome TaxID=938273 RepID=A0A0W8E6I5_9ZZZZ
MVIFKIMGILIVSLLITFIWVRKASAHCDTMEGPTVADGKKALETGNINYASKWIAAEFDQELQKVFNLAVKVRKMGSEAQELVDMYFLETLVRLHRMGEGVGYTGIKPYGTPIDPKIAAADRSIAVGNLSPLEGMVPAEQRVELKDRFAKVMALKDFDVNDVAAGRAYIAAYVSFFKFAEGEEHEHVYGHASPHNH